MKKEKDYIVEDLIRSVGTILDDIQSVALEVGETTGSRKRIENEMQKKEFEELALEEQISVDGMAEIRISKDDMQAIADFYPPRGAGGDITEEDVTDKLSQYGVVHGIEWETIRNEIRRCNDEQVQISGVIIARGTKPVEEIPKQYVIEGGLKKKKSIQRDENERIDFKKLTSYTLVSKGDVLAKVVPKKEGVLGKTVKGELVPYKKASVVQKRPGKNTAVEGEVIVAAADGRFELWNNHFWVHEVFEVYGDVDYHTGNIEFPGDIIIHGRVNDGFTVDAEGSINCKGTLDASKVTCKRDLLVNRGIIGRKKGTIYVGGEIRAKYIENSYVEADGPIYIETGILHSIVSTRGRLEMAKRSIIAGGKIYSQNGVQAGQIGTKMGIKTEIHCGIDHKVQQNLEWIRDKSVALATKLGQIEGRIKAEPEKAAMLDETKRKIKEYIHKLNGTAKKLVVQLDKNKKAEVVVLGTVFPGVYIEICRKPYVVTHEIEGVRFFLDRERGTVDVEPLL
ncbi:MAG: DUF342 domain-containing protein [Spirochaetes bacterium]|nr:DUF342 domain-containing protein [Spirochaetota bacterium]